MDFQVDGVEYLVGAPPKRMGQIIRRGPLGTPVLYPTPNRVRDAKFTFAGRTFEFEPNDGTRFLHGLVRDIPWECDEPIVTDECVSVAMRIAFEPGVPIYDLFPIRNTLEIDYTLVPGTIRLDFRVHNHDPEQLLPFGLGIHPFFQILGPRESVRLQVPAKKWMEAIDLLPTGRLLNLEEGPADLREPTRLSELDLDDLFWGLEPDHPMIIYYDDIGKKVTLTASDLFTHSVIFTPQTFPLFSVENQSCSTDAHNLYARGLDEEAHLSVLEPGQTLSAWIEIAVADA